MQISSEAASRQVKFILRKIVRVCSHRVCHIPASRRDGTRSIVRSIRPAAPGTCLWAAPRVSSWQLPVGSAAPAAGHAGAPEQHQSRRHCGRQVSGAHQSGAGPQHTWRPFRWSGFLIEARSSGTCTAPLLLGWVAEGGLKLCNCLECLQGAALPADGVISRLVMDTTC